MQGQRRVRRRESRRDDPAESHRHADRLHDLSRRHLRPTTGRGRPTYEPGEHRRRGTTGQPGQPEEGFVTRTPQQPLTHALHR